MIKLLVFFSHLLRQALIVKIYIFIHDLRGLYDRLLIIYTYRPSICIKLAVYFQNKIVGTKKPNTA